MRRIAFALVLLIASGWAAPSRAQWWGEGWGRPCFGGCRPWLGGGGWAGPRRFVVLDHAPRPAFTGTEGFDAPRFRAAGWGWDWVRMAWRREMRWRRFEAWRRWAGAGRQPASETWEQPRFRRWTHWRQALPAEARAARAAPSRLATDGPMRDDERRGAGRAEATVAVFPTGALHVAHPADRAAVLAAAAMLRRPVVHAPRPAPAPPTVVRVPEPPAQPLRAAFRPAVAASVPRADQRPAGLRNQPEALPASRLPAAQPLPIAPTPATPAAAPADVPVAPLE